MAHETLKTLITQNIKTNGRNAITAQILQDVLIAMVDDYPDISGYATRTWVQQQDYAPKEWVQQQGYATESALSDYLPLTGGTLTGDLNFTNEYGSGSIFVDSVDYDLNITASNSIYLNAERGVVVNGNVTATSFIKSGGTSAQFLKADGSVDGNAYLPVVNGIVSVSSGDMDIYSAGQQGGLATVFDAKNSQDVVFMGSPSYLFDGDVHASAFIKTNGISDEVLCADGSTKTLSELKAALDAL